MRNKLATVLLFSNVLFLAAHTAMAIDCTSSGQVVTDAGVLRQTDQIPGCLVFLADSGGVFDLENTAGFEDGDRVVVTGECSALASNCPPFLASRLVNNTIEPGFAGCGVMVEDPPGCVHFDADNGDTYLLSLGNGVGVQVGQRLYARGIVRDVNQTCARGKVQLLAQTEIGPCFESLGRFVRDETPNNGNTKKFETSDGVQYELDFLGSVSTQFPVGTFGYVEGIYDPACSNADDLACVRVNTITRAFAGCGMLNDQRDCGLTFIPDSKIDGDAFVLSDTADHTAGDRIYVLGRFSQGCAKPHCSAGCLDKVEVGECFFERGTLFGGTPSCLTLRTEAGQFFLVEHTDFFTTLEDVTVTGALEAASTSCGTTDPVSVVADNLIRRSFNGCGTLRIGFECSPLFIADDGGAFNLENFGPFAPDDRVRVIGELSGSSCSPLCPFSCIINNTIASDPICEGIQ